MSAQQIGYALDPVALEASAVERLARARDWLDHALGEGDVPTARMVSRFAWSLVRAQHLLEIAEDVRRARGEVL